MEINQFNESQLVSFYNDPEFLSFISGYFSSYDPNNISLSVGTTEDQGDINWKIYVRILLANIKIITDALENLRRTISFSYNEKNILSTGEIRGRLLVNEYVKKKTMVSIPRGYPCVVKTKSYITPENEYISFIIRSVIDKLIELLNCLDDSYNSDVLEIRMLHEYLDYFIFIQSDFPFNSFSNSRNKSRTFSANKLNLVFTRLSKGKIIKSFIYENIFNWFDMFIKNGFVWIDTKNINMLIYDEKFSNKLFEIWCLYKIILKFQTDYNMTVINKNELTVGLASYVCKLKTIDGNTVEIYYQKGKGLYWDERCSPNWHYTNPKKELIGIPDISIKYIAENENLTLVDLKNRVRNGGDNSEEIYKLIGYFANFSSYLNKNNYPNCKKRAVLVFRNDKQAFQEKIENYCNECILALSVSVNASVELCENQFKEICSYALGIS